MYHFGIIGLLAAGLTGVLQETGDFTSEIGDGEIGTEKFADGFAVKQEIDQRNVADVTEGPFHDAVEEFAALEGIADHLRHLEISRFERGGSGGYGRYGRCPQEGVLIIENDLDWGHDAMVVEDGLIIIHRHGGRTCDDELMSGETAAALNHDGQVIGYLGLARTRQDGDDVLVGVQFILVAEGIPVKGLRLDSCEFVHRGIAHIIHLVAALVIPIHLEGQDGEHEIDILADFPEPIAFPGPDFGRYIIDNFGAGHLALHPGGNEVKIEAGIINQNHCLGIEIRNSLPALAASAQDFGQMADDGPEAHVGQSAVMTQQRTAHSLHLLTSEITEFGVGVLSDNGLHQMGSVEIARGLACNQKIFHIIFILDLIILYSDRDYHYI